MYKCVFPPLICHKKFWVFLRNEKVIKVYIFAKNFIISYRDMAKKEEMIEGENAMQEASVGAPEATPNRDAYASMWGEDNADVDFNDKEARYGRMVDDRNELRERRKSDAALGGLFDKHNWLATMYMELKDNPDMNPFVWLADFCQEQGISLQEVMDDPEAQKFLTDKMATRQKDNAEREKKSKADAEEKDANLQKSLDALEQLQKENGLSDEDALAMWGDFWQVIDDAQKGNVSVDTWKAFSNSRTYADDVANAASEAGMRARNEKIQNKVRKPSEQSEGMPPTLGQGMGGTQEPKKPAKKSFGKSFFEDIE